VLTPLHMRHFKRGQRISRVYALSRVDLSSLSTPSLHCPSQRSVHYSVTSTGSNLPSLRTHGHVCLIEVVDPPGLSLLRSKSLSAFTALCFTNGPALLLCLLTLQRGGTLCWKNIARHASRNVSSPPRLRQGCLVVMCLHGRI
jgi:hypothetical protein